ncbi:hypothetical protein KY290_014777 [Solanum tuberosum]|uniref:Uncharacterized protein n=1 Tax=Solanum tuberosum TaxID=4113 RepID=A0ABQ7VQJ8_SOLTU|nr:hypothetical protein KY284_014181 [Solanum tuberosum]KAH0770796.1 hypothetical protein KY290_014777 [Solanum tuberosum]
MSTTGDDWAGNCVLMIVGLHAIDRGLSAIDSYRKYRKEQNVKLKVEVNQNVKIAFWQKGKVVSPSVHMYSTLISGTRLEEEEKGA